MRVSHAFRFLSLIGINMLLLSWQTGLAPSLELSKIFVGILFSLILSGAIYTIGKELEDPVAWLLFLAVIYLGVGILTTILRFL